MLFKFKELAFLVSLWIFGGQALVAQTAPVSISFSRSSSWASGYSADITITNNSTSIISGWSVAFDLPVSGFSKIWNAVEGASTATRKEFSNLTTNANINPGASRSFGFNAIGAFTVAATNFTFKGLVPAGNLPSFSIADVTLDEGNAETIREFVVTLANTASTVVTVDWMTVNDTALGGEDYVTSAGVLSFAPGELSKSILVPVKGDLLEEPDESFTISLSNPVGAPILRSAARILLVNDDFTPGFGISNSSVVEGNEGSLVNMVFTVTLTPAASTTTRINYQTLAGSAVIGTDFTAVSGSLEFSPGQTLQQLSIPVTGDSIQESPEVFSLQLSQPEGAILRTPLALGTIYDNDGGGSGGRPQTGTYNFAEVLQKSLWFYDVQRSGKLPDDFRVRWRADSALQDGSDVGRDLSGGFYDAGDHVKFGLPLAYSLTVLAWGGVEYGDAYEEAQQLAPLRDTLKWGADYLMKCHERNPDGSTAAFYGQVGEGDVDHAYWGRAESMVMNRPSYKIDALRPGSDLAAETAASMAATSMLFKVTDPAYAATLLEHARALFTFADTYRGKYSDSIPDAAKFYRSWSGFQDELTWGAIWLYRATGEAAYLAKAKVLYNGLSGGGAGNHPYQFTLSWDDTSYGCYILMAMLDGGAVYRADAERWLDYWTVGVNNQRVPMTPGGLAWRDPWGSLRYAANTAFCAFVYGDRVANPAGRYTAFARRQIEYALGSNPTGNSYVCGFGTHPPQNPHHRNAHASTSNDINSPLSNRHVLFGALVGGPDITDGYTDSRTDYQKNEVAMDYNAGFTGAVARLYREYGGYTLDETVDPPTPQTLLHSTLDDFPVGPKTDRQWLALWPGTIWANGPDDGRLAVNDEVAYGGSGRSVRVLYPKGGKQSANSGAQWFMDLNGSSEELYLSYWLRFDEDFDFVLGGKLPGLGGAVSFQDRTHEWSGRLMWRENGKAEFYIHTPANNLYNPGTRFWWNTEGFQAVFIPGRWHHIETHIRLNTPGQFDGLMEGWFDGVKAAHYPAFYFRDAPTASAKIAWVFFSTFFGGSSSDIWQASKNDYATFDEFTVANRRIGYPGIPRDVDADRLPNEWETTFYGTDSAANPSMDTDLDGEVNLMEYIAGTDPKNASDRFKSSGILAPGGMIQVETEGKQGRRYHLQGSRDLKSWADIAESEVLTSDRKVSFPQPGEPLGGFYRIGVSNPAAP